jgi:uncharacterized protein YcgL (UPF0745 family)
MEEWDMVGTDSYSNYTADTSASVASAAYSTKAASTASAKTTDAATQAAAGDGVVYEKSSSSTTKATYSINKMSSEDRAALVQQLKDDQTSRQNQLSSLVQQMLSKQAGASNLADMFSAENLKGVSAADIAQAKEDVSEDGYWGISQTSQRLFDFASALAGDDEEQMQKMQEAIEKGFKQATKAWGKDLPSICQDTLTATNKLFDDYYASKKTEE